MLRKRSRTMTTSTKQAQQSLMAENGSLQSPTQMKPISSFFNSPRFFSGFSAKGSISETESAMSPTSILDNKSFSAIGNPFWTDKTHPTSRLSPEPSLDNNNNKHPWEKKPEGIVDVLDDDDDDNDQTSNEFFKPKSRMVLFGSQLKIQIPPLPPSVLISPTGSPNSPADFGIKTRNTQIRSLSFSSPNPPGPETPVSPFTGCLSASEMELSEDYTCVISHGPNPRTTHIFGDCIVENCCGFITLSSTNKESYGSVNRISYPSEEFLSFCYHCKRNLGHGKDIYMYRGEKAFCSRECRFEEMELDEAAME